MKRVLVTAGCVYSKLDDNKLVGNRIRGIWATKFAGWLHARGYEVVLLTPDTMDKKLVEDHISVFRTHREPERERGPFIHVSHGGYESYAEQCYAFAPTVDAAVMAAAVVNWIPSMPIKGKMRTEGYAEGDVINIPFILAPRVIDRMRKLNPKLTLIGCKMTSGSEKSETLKAAYQTLLKAHCNVVVANDLSRLKHKMLVYPDGNVVGMDDFDRLYGDLEAVLRDEHYHTEPEPYETYEEKPGSDLDRGEADLASARLRFDALVEKYRARFVIRPSAPSGLVYAGVSDEPDRVFGSVAVRIDAVRILVSPREKGTMFSSKDAVVVTRMNEPSGRRIAPIVRTVGGEKATLNAPLLIRVMARFDAPEVIHLHEEHPEWPTLPYAPPGTVRDNDRTFSEPAFNIDGHGCVFVET